jgi:hypothetical protein
MGLDTRNKFNVRVSGLLSALLLLSHLSDHSTYAGVLERNHVMNVVKRFMEDSVMDGVIIDEIRYSSPSLP